MTDEREPDSQEPPDATHRFPPSEPTGTRVPRRGAPVGPPPPAESFHPGRPVRPAAPSGPAYASGQEATPRGESGTRRHGDEYGDTAGHESPPQYGGAAAYDSPARREIGAQSGDVARYDSPAGYDSGGRYGGSAGPDAHAGPNPYGGSAEQQHRDLGSFVPGGPPEPAPRPRRRRRRWPKILAIVLAFLLVLFVIGDRVGVRIANGEMKKRIEAEIAAQAEPGAPPATVKDVSLGGFPFLTQVLLGNFKDIRFTIENITTPGPRIQQVRARLQGVHVPLGDAIRDDVGQVPVDDVEGTAVVTYADLNAFLERDPKAAEFFKDLIPGYRGLRVDPEGNGKQVRATLTVDVPIIGEQDFAGVASFKVREGVLFLDVEQIGVGGTFTGSLALPSAFQFDFPVPELPLKLQLADAGTNATGLSLTVRAKDVVLPAG